MRKSIIFFTVLCISISASELKAADSVWYSDGDPLSTKMEILPVIYGVDLHADAFSSACGSIDLKKPLSLAAVSETALCNNPQTQAAYASAKIQAAQLGVAKSAYLPSVSDSMGVNGNITSQASATRGHDYYNLSNNLAASYLLYDFGNRDATLENARQLLQAASASESATVQSVLLAAVKAYFQVQTDMASLAALQEAESFYLESFKAAEAKYKAGVSTPADKLQAQTAYAQSTLTRISAEGTLRSDYGALANVMGLHANTPITLVSSISKPANTGEIENDINQLIEQAHIKRPDLLASEAQINAAKASVDASRAAAKPTLTVNLSNSLQDGSNLTTSNTATLGVTVSIPIFSGYAPTYKIRAAEAAAELRESQRDQLRLQISLDVWTAFQNLRTAHETIKSVEVLVSSAKESARVAFGRYKAGVGNIIDTLSAQNSLASANQQKIRADLNLNIARAALAQSIGSLDNVMIQSLPSVNKEMSEAKP